MSTKSTMYLAIIFCGFFLGFVIPFNTMLGSPLSLILLAFFQPFFKWRKTLLIYGVLFIMNTAFNFHIMLWAIQYTLNYFTLMEQQTGTSTNPILAAPFTIGIFLLQRTTLMFTAFTVIKKSGIYKRFSF